MYGLLRADSRRNKASRYSADENSNENSNLTFEKDECVKEYEELGLKELKELIEADRKDEQTEREDK